MEGYLQLFIHNLRWNSGDNDAILFKIVCDAHAIYQRKGGNGYTNETIQSWNKTVYMHIQC